MKYRTHCRHFYVHTNDITLFYFFGIVMAGRSLNKACILGNAGKDAEIRYTNNGKAVATFSIATNESWKDQSGTLQERTTWHNIVAWERMAEICGNYVKKGKQLYVEGRIQNRQYDDKDGVKK